jgi:hypothetical protein
MGWDMKIFMLSMSDAPQNHSNHENDKTDTHQDYDRGEAPVVSEQMVIVKFLVYRSAVDVIWHFKYPFKRSKVMPDFLRRLTPP